ncbi:MAG: hypothetical protein H6982_00005, partial [Chromatiales bacterium]|nr:hypothetical protein [Chromatiales bacterium]
MIAVALALPAAAMGQDNFPPGGVVPPGWTVPAAADAGWQVAGDFASEGVQSLRSDPITHHQRAEVEVTANVPSGFVSFARRVSSEVNFDFLRFYVDGVQLAQWSGFHDWATVNFPVSAGTHAFRWAYTKDGSVDDGADTAWIDEVWLPGEGPSVQVRRFGAGTVTSSVSGIACGADCDETFPDGTVLSLLATPDPGWGFDGWTATCAGACAADCAGTGSCNLTTGTGQIAVDARFVELGGISVGIVGGGRVQSSPSGIDCPGTCLGQYPPGTAVTLTATPSPGWTFERWLGNCSGNGTGECVEVTTSGINWFIQPIFVALRTLQTTVTPPGAGRVTSSPSGIDCPTLDCVASYADGTDVTLTATPAPGFRLVGWTGACSGTGACTVPMTQSRAVGAEFAADNAPPVIGGTPPTVVAEDDAYGPFVPTASDPDGGPSPLVFEVSGKPPWATFDPATGALGGTP